tara:strand:+ start:328 stop:888 length:561 start_codon:yes stop_codon:yes gene_type:complete
MSKDNSFSITKHSFPPAAVDYIEELTYKLPWFFFKDCAYGNTDHPLRGEMNPYFSHTFLKDNEIDRSFFNRMPWNEIGREIGLPNNKMIRAHMTLQYPKPHRNNIPHNPHTDNNKPHIVGLYYPNETDGDTFFFDDDLNVIHQEPPERGKMVVFDGKTLHSSSSPSKNVRFSLNINYEPTPRTSNS